MGENAFIAFVLPQVFLANLAAKPRAVFLTAWSFCS